MTYFPQFGRFSEVHDDGMIIRLNMCDSTSCHLPAFACLKSVSICILVVFSPFCDGGDSKVIRRNNGNMYNMSWT